MQSSIALSKRICPQVASPDGITPQLDVVVKRSDLIQVESSEKE